MLSLSDVLSHTLLKALDPLRSILGLVGYDARLTRERSRVQSSEDVFLGLQEASSCMCTSCLLNKLESKCSILGLVGYDARLTRERSRVQSSEDVFFVFL